MGKDAALTALVFISGMGRSDTERQEYAVRDAMLAAKRNPAKAEWAWSFEASLLNEMMTKALSRLPPQPHTPRMDTLWVADMAVLGDTPESLCRVLALLGPTVLLRAVAGGQPAFSVQTQEGRALALKMWQSARKKVERHKHLVSAAKLAGAASAAKRIQVSEAGIERIRDRWPLPSSQWSTAALLAEAGLSRNTVQARLGRRPIAQYKHQEALRLQSLPALAGV